MTVRLSHARLVFALTTTVLALMLISAATAGEFRGIWVDAFHPGFKTPEQTTEMVDKVADANLNAILVEVRKRGDAYYDSTIVSKGKGIAPDYDPLADIIAKAHAKGIEVHAWLTLFEAWTTVYGTPPEGHVCAQHPDWLTKDASGRTDWFQGRVFLDPGHPQVQEYLVKVVAEVARKYPVDGIHLLEFMYPSPMSGYNDTSVARFMADRHESMKPDPHDAAWRAWRQDQLTQLLTKINTTVSGIKPGLKLSTAVRPKLSEARWHFLQDWPSWMEAKLVDFVVPMNYRDNEEQFQGNLANAAMQGFDRHVYMGHGTWMLPPEAAAKRVKDTRSAGCPGFVLYNYAYLFGPWSGDGEIMRSIKKDAIPDNAAVPSMPWKARK